MASHSGSLTIPGGGSGGMRLRRLTENCLNLFAECLRAQGLSIEQRAWFEDYQARFRWWSFGLKAQALGRASLDYRLTHRDDARVAISGLLTCISGALNDYLAGLRSLHSADDSDDQVLSDASSPVSVRSPFSESSTDEDAACLSYSEGVILRHARLIELCLYRLARLSIAIRKSGDRFRHKRADDDLKQVQIHAPNTYAEFKAHLEILILIGPYEHSLLSRLALAESRNDIPRSVGIVIRAWLHNRLGPVQRRLVQANIIRRHRIMCSRKRGRQTSATSSDVTSVRRQAATMRPSAHPPQQIPAGPTEVTRSEIAPTMPAVRAIEQASAIQTATAVGPDLNTAALRSVRTSSVASKLTRTGQHQDYPKSSVLENSPQCPYCGFVLDLEYAKDEKKWHITRWSCSQCSSDLDGEDEIAFATASDYQAHILENHSGLFAPEELPVLLDLSERTMIELVSCPLCLNDRNLVHLEEDDHVATHLHSFSLRALPWDFDLDEGAASAGSGDSPQMPGARPVLDESDEEPEDDTGVLEDMASTVRGLLETVLAQPDGEGRLSLLPATDMAQAANLLLQVEAWASSAQSTASQKQTCTFLLGRVQDNLGKLTAEDSQDKNRMSDLGANIALDLQALEECIYERARQDHDIWQESFRSLPDNMRKTVQAIIDDDEVSSHPLPDQLDNLLKLSWRLEEKCRNRVHIKESQLAQDVASSVQQLADDESIFLSPQTDLPWAVLSGVMKLALELSDASSLSTYHGVKRSNALWALQFAFRAINRGRLYGLAYKLENTSEESFATLRFAQLNLYGALLELLVIAKTKNPEPKEKEIARAIANPKMTAGFIAKLYALTDQLESEVQSCRQGRIAEVDPEVLRLLEDTPPIRLDPTAQDSLLPVTSEEQSDTGDEDEEEWDLMDLEWMSSLPYDKTHKGFRERRAADTCEWLLNREDFSEWVTSDRPAIFWLRGSFGTGKTFLSSKVIDHIQERVTQSPDPEGLAFIYCEELGEAGHNTQMPLLRSIMRQLLEHGTSGMPRLIKRLHKDWGNAELSNSTTTNDRVTEWLLEVLRHYQSTTLILDGLDRLAPHALSELAATLAVLADTCQQPLKLFLSSRENREVSHLTQASTASYQVILQHWNSLEAATAKTSLPHTFFDIEKVVTEQWKEVPPDVLGDVVHGSEGVFLWAVLRTQQLQVTGVDNITRSTTETLPVPEKFLEVYRRADDEIQKLDKNDLTIGRRALKLVLCAAHPLTSDELLSALRIDPETDNSGLRSEIGEDWLRHLWPDVLVLSSHPELGLIWAPTHISCVQFFSRFDLEGHLDAARICLKLLLEALPNSVPDQTIVGVTHPAQIYARHYWLAHVRAASDYLETPDSMMVRLLKKFLGSPGASSEQYRRWYKAVERDDVHRPPESDFSQLVLDFIAPETQTLFAICRFSLFKIIEDWRHDPSLDLSGTNKHGKTLLEVVSIENPISFTIGRELVELGVDVNQPRGDFPTITTPLSRAVETGDAEWVQFLIAHGARVDPDVGSALALAASMDRADLVHILLGAGALVDADNDALGFGSVLAAATASAGPETISMIIDAGADVNRALDRNFGSALAAAGRNQNPDALEIFSLLLSHGADPNMLGRHGLHTSALGEACLSRNLPCVKSLIQAGAHVNQEFRSGSYGSALIIAASLGDIGCLNVLIEAGTDVNQVVSVGDYGTALIAAARQGNLNCLLVLVTAGADVNQLSLTGLYGTALVAAAGFGREDCVRALVEFGADVDRLIPAGKHGSALAASAGHADCMHILIDAGANVNQVLPLGLHGRGGTALIHAAENGLEESLEILIEAGANVNFLLKSERARCGSALVAAAFAGSSECVKALLRAGAEVDQEMLVGIYGSALMAAAGQGMLECAQALVAAGADVNKQVNQHPGRCGTALVAAAYMGRLGCASFLIRKGATVNLKLRGHFRDALHAAMEPVTDEYLIFTPRRIGPTAWFQIQSGRDMLGEEKADVIRLLKNHGASVEEQGSQGL
ncbi:Serine/threonine-protein phosphatase 6 regulatory ankyrin repeat subunit B [Madurella mycetomatis]|uniref:Serine/threonine-protein phosphatase 6 regulatory ankyrin repeat subunit B n=1 Tax=Madurella mycetomatis TaxID=100816 RepID=A0A175WFP4_9PEZI|nr:Serine/threonine-protein phosphatase 6 regulatory ankyrin repeat subunit B [Madurella mycetomatis]